MNSWDENNIPKPPMMEKLILHKVLKQLLEKRGVSARQVSRETGIPQSTITSFLSGRGQHKPEQLLAVAKYFGVSLELLLFGKKATSPTLEEILTEQVFDGWLRVRIERAIPNKNKIPDGNDD